MDTDSYMFVASGHLGKYSFAEVDMGPTTEMLSNMSIAKYNSYCVKMHAACVKFQ
jgi:hypothetical protein